MIDWLEMPTVEWLNLIVLHCNDWKRVY